MEKLSLKKKIFVGGKETVRTKPIQIRFARQVHPLTFFFFKEKEKLPFNSTKILKEEETSLKRIKGGLGEEKGGNTRQTQKKRQ